MTCLSSGESTSWALGTATVTVCSSLSVGTGPFQSIPYPVSYMIEDYLVIPSPQLIKQYIQALHVQQCTCIETNTYVIRCTKSFHTAMVCWKILQTHALSTVGRGFGCLQFEDDGNTIHDESGPVVLGSLEGTLGVVHLSQCHHMGQVTLLPPLSKTRNRSN